MIYLLQVSICWVIFFMIYHFFLRNETFFTMNRGYLLGSLVLGLTIPFMAHFIPQNTASEVLVAYNPTLYLEVPQAATETTTFNIWQLLWSIYFIGMAFMAARFLWGLRQIYNYYKDGEVIRQDDITFIYNDKPHLPFSFFNGIYISNSVPLKDHVEQIIKHEIVHAKQLHSLDIILIEVLHILFWFNPILILYKKAFQASHEYLADACVLQDEDKGTYSDLLVGFSSTGLEAALSNQFFHSQLKNRIDMIYRKNSDPRSLLKYLLALPIIALVFLSFVVKDTSPSQVENISPVNMAIEMVKDTTRDVYKLVDEMPRFPGCEDMLTTRESIEECSRGKLLEYIYGNVKYPESARKAGIEGMVVAQFIILTDGTVDDIKIIRKLGYGLDEETMRVIKGMNDLPERWIPGKMDGKAVNVMYTFPMRFKLDSDSIKDKEDAPPPPPPPVAPKAPDNIGAPPPPPPPPSLYKIVEEMPRFPGCEGVINKVEREECAKKRMLEYLYDNLQYPKAAKDAGTDGMAVVSFIINTEGKLVNLKLLRDPGDGTGEEALRVVKSMNSMTVKWIPGKERGITVDVLYTLPIRFKLSAETKKEEKKE